MIRPLVGVSSVSLDHASPCEIIKNAERIGAECLDLRAGRGQAWESDLRSIVSSIPVLFVGSSITLGQGTAIAASELSTLEAAIGLSIPIRCFAGRLDNNAGRDRFCTDLTALKDRYGGQIQILIEPHGATPALAELAIMLQEFSIGAIVDTFGLVRLREKRSDALDFGKRYAAALQVKGVKIAGDRSSHVPLRAAPLLCDWLSPFVRSLGLPITVETKAGSAPDDIAILKALLAGATIDPSAMPPEEITKCVCA